MEVELAPVVDDKEVTEVQNGLGCKLLASVLAQSRHRVVGRGPSLAREAFRIGDHGPTKVLAVHCLLVCA
jgi:hypothetical protein